MLCYDFVVMGKKNTHQITQGPETIYHRLNFVRGSTPVCTAMFQLRYGPNGKGEIVPTKWPVVLDVWASVSYY